MPENNNGSVIIYQSWFETAQKLGAEKQRKAIMQILNYGFYGTIPDNSADLSLDLLFNSWRPLVDAAERHRRGGAPKGNQNAKGHGAPKGNSNAKGHGAPKGNQNAQKQTNNLNKQPFNGNCNCNGNGNYNNGLSSDPSKEGSDSDLEKSETEDGEVWEDPQVAFEKWKKKHETV